MKGLSLTWQQTGACRSGTASDFYPPMHTERKHAVPLLAELDHRGVTRRRGDLRIAGNRLPAV